MKLPEVSSTPLKGTERFQSDGASLDWQVRDYWSWAYSDLLINTSRGVFAEFLVATALGLTGGVRKDWDAADLVLPSEVRVEVKSAAYLQSWAQDTYSRITFRIAPTSAWDPESNTYAERRRNNDVYVFCLLAEKDPQKIDPLNLNQWRFYVLATSVLDQQLGPQQTITLSRLLQLQPESISYAQLADAIETAAKTVSNE